jgi:hypothetical protein
MGKKDDCAVLGVGFYRKEQWPLLLETADDRAELEDTYEEWVVNLKKSLENMRKLGIEPLRVDIDIHELNAWCTAQGLKRDGEARAEFIAELLRQEKGRSFGIV